MCFHVCFNLSLFLWSQFGRDRDDDDDEYDDGYGLMDECEFIHFIWILPIYSLSIFICSCVTWFIRVLFHDFHCFLFCSQFVCVCVFIWFFFGWSNLLPLRHWIFEFLNFVCVCFFVNQFRFGTPTKSIIKLKCAVYCNCKNCMFVHNNSIKLQLKTNKILMLPCFDSFERKGRYVCVGVCVLFNFVCVWVCAYVSNGANSEFFFFLLFFFPKNFEKINASYQSMK